MVALDKTLYRQMKLAYKRSKINIFNNGTTIVFPRYVVSDLFAGALMITGTVMIATSYYQFGPRSKDITEMKLGQAKMSKDISELMISQAKMSKDITEMKLSLTKLEVAQNRMSENIAKMSKIIANMSEDTAQMKVGQAKLESFILQLISNQK